jgi:tRNA-dihydrouridine synthase
VTFLDKLPKPFFVLAPMDDVTDTVLRQIVADLAPPDFYMTEFVNVDGLQSPGRERLLKKLRFTGKERPIVAQLWGTKPENFYKTVKELKQMGFDGVDLNFGCPVKNVVKAGACAALINNRELAGEIIEASREAAGEQFPLSVKTRVGFNTTDLSWIEFLLTKKLDLLSIHGRTAKQLSKVPPNWDLIGQTREMRDVLCPSTLIVGNGDVMSRSQGLKLAEKYQLDGIMVGRGIFEDPFLFAEKSPWGSYSREQKLNLYRKHIELFAKTWKNGERRIETLNKFCKIYISGFSGAKELREELMSAKSTQEALDNLSDQRELYAELEKDQSLKK